MKKGLLKSSVNNRCKMNELYSETYVRSKASPKRMLARIGLIALCVVLPILALLLFKNFIAVIIAIVVDAVIIYFLPTTKVAYEYVFVDGQIDFDCIYNGEKRKNIQKIDMEQVDIVAPENSHALDSYKNLPLIDCSSLSAEDKQYILAGKAEKGNVRIRFTPDEKMLDGMMMKGRSKFAK